MLGLVVFGAMALYLLLSIVTVVLAVRYARKRGGRAWAWGASAALVMYLIPFWDWIPTEIMHRYYCEKESGFWIYKTVEQWRKENPGVMETLVANKGAPPKYEQFDAGRGRADTYLLNNRFSWIVIKQDYSEILPVIRSEEKVKDEMTNEVLARYVDYGTGNSVKNTIGPPGPMKFWLRNRHCSGGERNDSRMWQFTKQFKGIEK